MYFFYIYSPPPYILARPVENNILEWHYVIRGPPDTPYHGGEYYGKLTFPTEYPYKPPAIRMSTPSGRFQPDTRLCLTMSDFHPSLWNPSWSVATILNGLLSFMTTDENTTGSIKTTDAEKKIYALRSHRANLKMAKFRDVFPDLCTPESNLQDEALRKRTIQQRHQSNVNNNTNNNAHITNNHNHEGIENNTTISSTMTKWKRWALVLVVFIYLILSKIASRSAQASSN
ncbi:unnamed protein product [Cunninghamella echinulata]